LLSLFEESGKVAMIKHFQLFFMILMVLNIDLKGQADTIPLLYLVNIDQTSGQVEISWTRSASQHVAGYIIYSYRYDPGFPGGGYAADPIDTIWGISSTDYFVKRPLTSFQSESYVVVAINNVFNKTPLSNPLNTIYLDTELDTCNRRILINWNNYPSHPDSVMSYSVLESASDTPFTEIIRVKPDVTAYMIDDFEFDSRYCYVIRANLKSGSYSGSNVNCIQTKMQKPPDWINADYATVGSEGKIILSFTIDPLSEITSFSLERQTGENGIFQQIKKFSSVETSILYTDNEADIYKINHYRLAAVNSCNIPVVYSNTATNMVLSLKRNYDDIELGWNPYRKWMGETGNYKLFVNTGTDYEEISTVYPPDSVFLAKYSDMMYKVSGREICFLLKAYEISNPYGISGESSSSPICFPVVENIAVPDLFIPEGTVVNEVNRYFQPVLSFIPEEYHLQITDLRRHVVFETRDLNEKWDGRNNGALLPEGVYIWILKIRTPSGNIISKTGNITLKINR